MSRLSYRLWQWGGQDSGGLLLHRLAVPLHGAEELGHREVELLLGVVLHVEHLLPQVEESGLEVRRTLKVKGMYHGSTKKRQFNLHSGASPHL